MSTVLAIDLAAHEVKLLAADGNRLQSHATVLIPEAGFTDGTPTPLLSATLKQAVEAGGFRGHLARVAIPDSGVAIRDFPLPAVPRGVLASAVLFEGRRLVPMDAADVYYAWHAARTSFGYAVYLVAARRDMIDAITSMVSAAGLRLDRMDLKPLALLRGANLENGFVLDWSTTEATLVLVVNGRPRFFRTFLLDTPPDDTDGQLDELTLTLNALVKFIRSAEPDVSIGSATRLILGGRFAGLDQGFERARQRFEFAVESPRLSLNCPPDLPWQTHLSGLGLLRQRRWLDRQTPSQGGDIRVAA